MAAVLGKPAAADPISSAVNELEVKKLLSVFTTSRVTTPSPSAVVMGTLTVSWAGRILEVGVNGPALIAPPAVATKKLTTEPAVKFKP